MEPIPEDRLEGRARLACGRRESVTRRMIYALALVPIVPATAISAAALLDEHGWLGPFDELRWVHFFASALCVTGAILVWRSLVLWTLGRKWLTALVSMIPFVQVFYGQPLWNVARTGCFDFTPGMMRAGQHEIGIGVWVWLLVWVWWGLEKRKMDADAPATTSRGMRMTPTAKRLAASIGLIPFAVGSFLIVQAALEDFASVRNSLAEAFACTALVVVGLWILLWRRVVAWSAVVVTRTAVIAIACLALPIAALWLLHDPQGGTGQIPLECLPIIGWGVWMALTIYLWPMSRPKDGTGRVTPACLMCGYPLIGLRATRFPECGDEPTLDDLWAGNVGEV